MSGLNFEATSDNSYLRSQNTVSDYLRILRINIWRILSFMVISGVLGYFIAQSIAPSYKANARLIIEQESHVRTLSAPEVLNVVKNPGFLLAQVEAIQSRELLESIVKKYRLEQHPAYNRPRRNGIIGSLYSTLGFTDKKDDPDPVYLEKNENAVMARFENDLTVTSNPKSGVIDISFESLDKNIVAKIANELSDRYLKKLAKSKIDKSQKSVSWLTSKMQEARDKLVESEAKLKTFQDSKKVGDSDQEKRSRSSRIGGITAQIVNARAKIAEIETIHNELERVIESSGITAAISILNDKAVNAYKKEQNIAQQKVNDLSVRYGFKHPKIIQARNSLAAAKKRTNAEMSKAVDRIKKERDLAFAREKEVSKLYIQLKSELRLSKDTEFDLAKLEMEVHTNREIYNLFLTRLKEVDIVGQGDTGSVKIIEYAVVPINSFKPDKFKILLISILLGTALGIAIAIFREIDERVFKSSDQLVEKLKLPLLGIFPHVHKRLTMKCPVERIVAANPRSTVSEAVNNIRTNLVFSNRKDSSQVILITSAIASEGKTTLSTNLSISLSRLAPTLILDADTRKPRVHKIFGSETEGGFLEYLSGKRSLKESVQRDDESKNLYCMPVHAIPDKPLELLSSKRFDQALKQLKTKFKYIIINAPPVLPVSDAVVISSVTDGVIFVVGSEMAPQKAVFSALSQLQRVGANVIGTVLTRANMQSSNYHSKYYYYSYDNYSEQT